MATLQDIKAEFLDERGWARQTPLPREQVREWLASDELEVLGAARHLLERKGGFARVEPPLAPQEKRLFLTRYFERALAREQKTRGGSGDESDSEWIDCGFDLSHGLVYWVADLVLDETTPTFERRVVLNWVRDLVLHHPGAGLIKGAVLDHLVWNRATRRYFKSWHEDPELAFLFGD